MKKRIIWGKGKIQRDLEYLFDSEKTAYYLSEENTGGKEEYPLSRLCGEDKDNTEIIVCEADADSRIKRLEEMGWTYKSNVYKAEDVLERLDFQRRLENKKILLWGTGNCAEEFWDTYVLPEKMDIIYCVDNAPSKAGKSFHGIDIVNIEQVENLSDYVVILAMDYVNASEVYKQIGDIVDKSQIVYYKMLLDRPSALAKEAIFSKECYGAECPRNSHMKISTNGNASLCCYLKNSVGNIFLSDLKEIWESVYARIIRMTLNNHSFYFCNKEVCPYLQIAEEKKDFNNGTLSAFYAEKDGPQLIDLNLGRNCNLHCASCRNEIFMADDEEHLERLKNELMDKVVEFPRHLLLHSGGEIFVSRIGKQILRQGICKGRKSIDILSNGTLFTRDVYMDLLADYDEVNVALSLDAATKETYEKIRRGGKFEILQRNLREIAALRKEGKISRLQFNFVVQKNNVSEMMDFVRMGEELGADVIAFSQLEKWGIFTDEEYEKNTVVDNNGIKKEYEMYFTKELIEHPLVNWFNLARYLHTDVKTGVVF